jgi:hypothetical protein
MLAALVLAASGCGGSSHTPHPLAAGELVGTVEWSLGTSATTTGASAANPVTITDCTGTLRWTLQPAQLVAAEKAAGLTTAETIQADSFRVPVLVAANATRERSCSFHRMLSSFLRPGAWTVAVTSSSGWRTHCLVTVGQTEITTLWVPKTRLRRGVGLPGELRA